MDFIISEDKLMIPFNLGDSKESIIPMFKDCTFSEDFGDPSFPNGQEILVAEYDLVLLFSEANKLIYVEFFSAPKKVRNLMVANIPVTYNKKMISNLKDEEIKIFKDEEGGYLIPKLNIRFTIPSRQGNVASLIFSNNEYFAETLELFNQITEI